MLLAHTLINREAFLQLCRALGIQLPSKALRAAWGKSLLAKYVPGGVWQIVGRAMVMTRMNVSRSRAVTASLIEQMLSLAICTLIAVVALMALHGLLLLAVGMTMMGAITLFLSSRLPQLESHKHAACAILLYTIAMPFYLGAYAILATGTPLLDLTAQLFTGTVAGMLVFFVPGGLGIRESVATLIASSATSKLLAAMIAVRLATVAIEACISLAALIGRNARTPIVSPKPAALRHLIVVGAALKGDGYPNAINTIKILKTLDGVQVIDHAHWLPEEFHLWRLARAPFGPKLVGAFRLGGGSLLSLARTLPRYRTGDTLYLPYPALPSLWLLSWLPSEWRPKIYCDAYITLWDSLYEDRRLGNPQSIMSRHLLNAESRGLRAADRVLVDTNANADHVSTLFGVERQRMVPLPLALPPTPSYPVGRSHQNGVHRTRILFVGTFVPLQGTTVIAKAIHALRDQDDLEFVLIGDGQSAGEAEPWLKLNSRTTWLRGWQSLQTIEQELVRADICLGVFGGSGKASRVLPFKLYRAFAAGKAIITQDAYSTPIKSHPLPVLTCPANPQALAHAIKTLSSDRNLRTQLQAQATAYYGAHLANERIAEHWRKLLQTSMP